MSSFGRFPWWVKVLLTTSLMLFLWWLAFYRIAGTPDWLESLGLLRWLRKLDPLDKWAVAATTFAAVIVALFQDRIRDTLYSARIDMNVLSGISIPVGVDGIPLTPVLAHHFRLGVKCKGPAAAKVVEVTVTEVWENGQQLNWWSPMALRWTDGNQPSRAILSARTTRLCDFLMVLEPGVGADQFIQTLGGVTRATPLTFDFLSQMFAKIMTSVEPRGLPNVLFPSKYTLGLELVAANAKPIQRFFDVEFNGQWSADPNAGIISIRPARDPT